MGMERWIEPMRRGGGGGGLLMGSTEVGGGTGAENAPVKTWGFALWPS